MSVLIIPSDVDLTIVRAVRAWFPSARVSSDIPSGWDWGNPPAPLIIYTVVGGQGIRNYAMDHTRVTFEVYDKNVDNASETARSLYGHLMHWQHEQAGVFYNGTVVRPVYRPYGGGPDEPSVTPGYWLTVELIFRSVESTGL